jgi:septum formation protein
VIPPLVLASASPRRKQLLEMLGIPCTVIPSQVPEVRIAGEKAIPYAERLAQSKALSVEGDLVLAADTIVVSGQSILEKPADEADAFHMLSRLRGHSHKVVTAVALSHHRQVRHKTDVTKVTFRHVSDDFIRAYVATGEPMDKAGAYAVQGLASRFITRIEGSYPNVVGLPVEVVYAWCGEAGIQVS